MMRTDFLFITDTDIMGISGRQSGCARLHGSSSSPKIRTKGGICQHPHPGSLVRAVRIHNKGMHQKGEVSSGRTLNTSNSVYPAAFPWKQVLLMLSPTASPLPPTEHLSTCSHLTYSGHRHGCWSCGSPWGRRRCNPCCSAGRGECSLRCCPHNGFSLLK